MLIYIFNVAYNLKTGAIIDQKNKYVLKDFELNEYFFYIYLNAFVAWLLSLKVHFHHFRFLGGGAEIFLQIEFCSKLLPYC